MVSKKKTVRYRHMQTLH